MTDSVCLHIFERSQAGEARRMASAWAKQRGCREDEQARLALVISELAANLVNHTTNGGWLLVHAAEAGQADAVEVLSLDKGPGNANFGAFLQDGYSTAGTAGTGLGAVRRASDFFDVHSQPEVGSALMSLLSSNPPPVHPAYQYGMVNVPIKGEEVCGDACGHCSFNDGRVRMMVADGLGHGPIAAEASRAALRVFRAHENLDLPALLEKVHGALRATRGAAVAVAEVDPKNEQVRYAGVGNIAGSIVNSKAETSHMVSMNGTLGMVQPRLQQFTYPWAPESLVVMTSDGLKSHWRLDHYPGLMNRHPSLIAGVLFRDHSRQTDDATAAVLRFCS